MHRLMMTSRRLSDGERRTSRPTSRSIRRTGMFWRDAARAARGRDHSRRDPGRRRHARSHARRAVDLSVHRSRSVRSEHEAHLARQAGRRSVDVAPQSLRVPKRSIRYPMFETFDQPNLVNSCDRRNRSTIAPQALLLMNNDIVFTQAKSSPSASAQGSGRRRRRAGRSRVPAGARRGRPIRVESRAPMEYRSSSGPERLAEFCQRCSTSTSSCTGQ